MVTEAEVEGARNGSRPLLHIGLLCLLCISATRPHWIPALRAALNQGLCLPVSVHYRLIFLHRTSWRRQLLRGVYWTMGFYYSGTPGLLFTFGCRSFATELVVLSSSVFDQTVSVFRQFRTPHDLPVRCAVYILARLTGLPGSTHFGTKDALALLALTCERELELILIARLA
jgi:hypothetical protein